MAVKAASKEVEIVVPEIKKGYLRVTIKGITPLLTHAFGPRARQKLADAQGGGPTKAKEPRDPQADYLDALYIIDAEAERYGFPASGVKKALVTAGGRFAGGVMTQLRGVITIPAELLEIKAPAPTMQTDIVRLSTGVPDLRYRPKFWPWEMDVPVEFNAGIITMAQVINLFKHAGFEVGIGDWRLESKNGMYGQFDVAEVAQL
jgi:hypothetical protein